MTIEVKDYVYHSAYSAVHIIIMCSADKYEISVKLRAYHEFEKLIKI